MKTPTEARFEVVRTTEEPGLQISEVYGLAKVQGGWIVFKGGDLQNGVEFVGNKVDLVRAKDLLLKVVTQQAIIKGRRS